jgi:hypothetical protein
MKKLFLSSIALFVFSISIVIFQMSCRKSAVAQSVTNSVSPISIILIERQDSSGTGGRQAYYTMNYDGSNLKQINVSNFPLTDQMIPGTGKLSPDGKILFFMGNTASGTFVYSINTNSTNINQLYQIPQNGLLNAGIDGAY